MASWRGVSSLRIVFTILFTIHKIICRKDVCQVGKKEISLTVEHFKKNLRLDIPKRTANNRVSEKTMILPRRIP